MRSSVEVSVIIATRNDSKRIGAAIVSVLLQSNTSFEILVVNDASTDDTASILQSYRHADSRIRIITNHRQFGRAGARNVGIANASGKFIAILDSDDIMFSERLHQQLTFIHQNPTVGILGTWAVFDVDSQLYLVRPPCDSRQIARHLRSGGNNVLINSSLLAYKTLFESIGGYQHSPYSPNFNEDYLTFRTLVPNTCFANLPEPLILVCTDGIMSPNIVRQKLSEMHKYELHTLHDNFTWGRITRLVLRRAALFLPDSVLARLYRRRLRSRLSFSNPEKVSELKRKISEMKCEIEKTLRVVY